VPLSSAHDKVNSGKLFYQNGPDQKPIDQLDQLDTLYKLIGTTQNKKGLQAK